MKKQQEKDKLPKRMRSAWLFTTLEKRANAKNILSLFAIVILINTGFYWFGQQIGIGRTIEGFEEPLNVLDLLFGYTVEQTYVFLEAYGEHGRFIYLLVELTLDLVYPLAYSVLITLVLIWLLKNSYPEYINYLYKWTFIPFLMGIIDLLENSCIIGLLLAYPNRYEWLAQLASFFTELKWLFAPFILTFMTVGIVTYFINRNELAKKNKKRYK